MSIVADTPEIRYNIHVVLPIPGNGGRCATMLDLLISFLISVMAGILSYFICKWLDRNDTDN